MSVLDLLEGFFREFFSISFLIEVAVFSAAIYVLLRFLRSTRGAGLVRGLILIGLVFGAVLIAILSSAKVQLPHLEYVFKAIVETVILAMVILFHPELRRGIARLGEHPLVSRFSRSRESKILGEVTRAVEKLARERCGALIAFERDFSLEPYIEEGVRLDGKVTSALLESIFHPGGALHDGAVIVRGERIAAASCLFPLTENTNLPKRFGTRHRAAIGLTENSDAITLVVSEETGEISISSKGEIEQGVAPDKLEEILRARLFNLPEGAHAAPSLS